MRRVVLPISLIFLLIAACSGNPSKQIIGKWQEIGAKGALIEFLDDGTFSAKEGGQSFAGKWSFLTDGRLKLEVSALGMTQIQTVKMAIEKGQLITTGEDGKVERYDRVK